MTSKQNFIKDALKGMGFKVRDVKSLCNGITKASVIGENGNKDVYVFADRLRTGKISMKFKFRGEADPIITTRNNRDIITRTEDMLCSSKIQNDYNIYKVEIDQYQTLSWGHEVMDVVRIRTDNYPWK